MKKLGLYVHIPFCEKKCDYCDFVSYCTSTDVKLQYINDLKKEIYLQAEKYKDVEVDSIFIGGGTPSNLPNGAIYSILSSIYTSFKVCVDAEITIECNPNSLTIAKLQEYKKAKINRLSIGLQCYNNKLLKLIGRLHTTTDFDNAVKFAELIGFKNISADLILGVPKQKLHHIKRELKHLLKLGINHISAYSLIVEQNTKLAKNLDANIYKLPSEKIQLKMLNYTANYLQKNGLERYEVSNFAKQGYESKHNLKYWTNQQYLGLGVVSSSYIDNKRWKNTNNLQEYAKQFENGQLEQQELEVLDKQSQSEERIMLSLRTNVGLDVKQFKSDFNIDLLQTKSKIIQKLVAENFVFIKDDHLICTNKGYNLLNQIILELID